MTSSSCLTKLFRLVFWMSEQLFYVVPTWICFICSFQGTVFSFVRRSFLLWTSGDKGIRTLDPLLARQVLSQLSYIPVMGLNGLEPSTSRLSGVRSNQLSFNPVKSGSRLFSHAVTSIVSSAGKALTFVFGMCTGVSPFRIATGSCAKLKQVRVERRTGQENLFSWIRPARRICGEAASEGPKVLSSTC